MTETSLLPIALASFASFLFGVMQVSTKRGLAHTEPQTGALITIGTAAIIYGLAMPWWFVPGQWFTFGFWVFVLNGLIHPMLSMRLAFEATARTGATVAATFSATTPIFAATIAVVFLGESVNPTIAVGTLCTVFGIATLSWNPGAATRIVRVALLLATGAAFLRGMNQPLVKSGSTTYRTSSSRHSSRSPCPQPEPWSRTTFAPAGCRARSPAGRAGSCSGES